MQELSSPFECLELRGASQCGAFGTCTQLPQESENGAENGTRLLLGLVNVNETCICQKGWFQTAEVSLYFISADKLDAGLGLCNINKGLLGTLYGLMLAISLLGLVMQSMQVSRWKQVRRLAPLFGALTLSSFTSFYRLVRFDQALIGKDIFFTVLVGNLAYLPVAATVIFTEKYLTFLTLKVQVFRAKTLKAFKLFQRFNRWVLILDVILYQLFWLSLFTSDQQKIGQIIFRVSLGALGIRAFTLFVIMRLTLTRFLRDMQNILDHFLEPDDINHVASSNTILNASNPAWNNNDEPAELNEGPNYNSSKPRIPKKVENMKMQIHDTLIPNTKQYRLFCDISIMSISIGYTFSALWPLLTYNISYITPFYHISWQVVNVAALFNNRSRLKKKAAAGDSTMPISTNMKSNLVIRTKSKNFATSERKEDQSLTT